MADFASLADGGGVGHALYYHDVEGNLAAHPQASTSGWPIVGLRSTDFFSDRIADSMART
nr:hypothetical protein [Halomonas populi]